MSSRDRDTKSLQDKLKVFFKKGAALPARNELVISAEFERELGPETPLHRRLRAIKEVTDKALVLRIHSGGVEKIWSSTVDLLRDQNPELRHAVLNLLRAIAEGQADYLLIMRAIMFRYLRETHPTHQPEDYQLRFKLLYTLTNTGKNITDFEEEIGPFLLEWLPQLQAPGTVVEFLQLIINVVKFNATYLDEDIVHGIVVNACHLCVFSAESSVVLCAVSLLEAVVSYSLLPRSSLRSFVCALARTVNIDHYCKPSWKLMRSVLGADIGHAALQEMLEVVGGAGGGGVGEEEAGLVRGAVFYASMALWGPRRVPTLKVSYLGVLGAFRKALEKQLSVVIYEVVLALQSLVTRVGSDLHDVAWDIVFDILRVIIDHDKSLDPPNELIHTRLHAVITALELLHDRREYCGDVDALFDLVDYCGHDRPESSTMRLVSGRCARACGGGGAAGSGAGWASCARALAERYVRRERRRAVRLHTLQALVNLIKRHAAVNPEEALEGVAGPLLLAAATDADPPLRAAAARALPALALSAPHDHCIDLIDLLEKILNRPFETYAPAAEGSLPAEADVSDVRLAAAALLDLLHAKLLRWPATHAMRCFVVLLDHLENHYKRPTVFANFPDIRMKIIEMLFGMRANSLNNVGFCYSASGAAVGGPAALRLRPLCSPYLLVEPLAPRGVAPAPPKDLPSGHCLVPAGRVALAVVALLTRERSWAVAGAALRLLPALLGARGPALGRRAAELDGLAAALLSLAADRARAPTSDLHAHVLPALAALAPCHAYLEPHTQQRIVHALLKFGMVLRSPQPYINALTVFTLETRDTMVKMLPGVLLDLSKISDTKAIAGPMLEFLSTLTRLPRVFASFVEDQYMSVFAILLPYTNPSRYNHYVVSLAHHVIAAWFLKCRLAYRRNFVQFIIHGLHNYIIMPFEEKYKARKHINEDSSNRKRSSSLGSKGTRPVGGAAAGPGAVGGASAVGGAAAALTDSAAFHVELTETCVDLLARYTFTPVSVKPQRSDITNFLFNGGQSTTWLVGHKLITITTSGCVQNSIKQGLCERCAVLCKQHAESAAGSPPPGPAAAAAAAAAAVASVAANVQVQVSDSNTPDTPARPPDIKRYSKHSLQHSRSTETSSSSLSISEALQPPLSGHTTRQNSSENSSSTNNHITEVLNQFTQKQERLAKEESEEAGWSRVGALAAAGACPCWCAQWCEVHVRAPSGDVSWVLRAQNHLSWDHLLESPLQDVLALLTPAAPAPPAPPSSSSSGIGDSRPDVTLESEPRSRSGSSTSQPRQPQDLHKSSSDTVVTGDKKHYIQPPTQPLRKSTQPINIPSSPQRQSSSSTNDEDDMLLIIPEGKSRHPVRRSNSSPEMSSSWKLPAAASPAPAPDDDLPLDPDDLILLPSEPATVKAPKKTSKKSDMRVSCEAIPEEISGTSPLALHPHLMTYNSDPGTSASPDAAVEALPSEPMSPHPVHLQKVASDSTVLDSRKASLGANKPPAAPRAAPGPAVAAPGPPAAASPPPGPARDDLPPLARSKRSNTISVMNPTRRNRDSVAGRVGGAAQASGGGITPSFVLLQLYHNMSTYPICPPVPGEVPDMLNPLTERPLKVTDVSHERTIKNLDLVPPVETYKVGVLYVGRGQQDDEVAILRNEYGSVRYSEFLSALGTLVSLDGDEDHPGLFLNLEKGGKDGHYTYVWNDDIMQVLFHVGTAMPYSERDPTCNEKRKYIGNDYVSIVYNDSGEDFNIHTIKGQLNFCIVVVEPLEHGVSRVHVKTKDERIRTKFLPHLDAHVVSDQNVALLARQHALHCALASHISQSLKHGGAPYASNSLERLRHIKRLRRRLEAERLAAVARAPKPYADHSELAKRVAIDDFNDYT